MIKVIRIHPSGEHVYQIYNFIFIYINHPVVVIISVWTKVVYQLTLATQTAMLWLKKLIVNIKVKEVVCVFALLA